MSDEQIEQTNVDVEFVDANDDTGQEEPANADADAEHPEHQDAEASYEPASDEASPLWWTVRAHLMPALVELGIEKSVLRQTGPISFVLELPDESEEPEDGLVQGVRDHIRVNLAVSIACEVEANH